MIEKRDFYINGQWVAPAQTNDFEVIDPSTEEPCAVISLGGEADTNAAVAAARAALPGWMATPVGERIALVEKLIEVYQTRTEDLAQAMSAEMGAPIDMARSQQVGAGAWHLSNFIKAAKAFEFDRPLGDHAPNDRIIHEAVGVAALITPWNWPMNQIALKAIPAILAGCTCVLKPSEESPLNAMIFAEMMDAAGFPKGVFNLVNGDGAGVGSQLSSASGCGHGQLYRLDPRWHGNFQIRRRYAEEGASGTGWQRGQCRLCRCRRQSDQARRAAHDEQHRPIM